MRKILFCAATAFCVTVSSTIPGQVSASPLSASRTLGTLTEPAVTLVASSSSKAYYARQSASRDAYKAYTTRQSTSRAAHRADTARYHLNQYTKKQETKRYHIKKAAETQKADAERAARRRAYYRSL